MESLVQFGVSENGAAAIKSALRVAHLLGLALGLGAATLLDLVACRFLANGLIHEEQWKVVRFASKVVTAGLVLLWISGFGFLAHYAVFSPASLENPKIWAKLAIVAILTLNGFYIHARVLPFIRSRIGRRLFDGVDGQRRTLMLASGVVSATSWLVPMALGATPQLNFVVPVTTILMTYAALLTVAIAATTTFGQLASRKPATFGKD